MSPANREGKSVPTTSQFPLGYETHDRDSVATGAGVALEHDVAALVDCKAIILVVDRASWHRLAN